jgi:hypothetical protein
MIQPVAPAAFDAGFRRFQDLVKLKSGRPFGGFEEGFAAPALPGCFRSLPRTHHQERLPHAVPCSRL